LRQGGQVVAHLLKPAAMERPGDLGERLRAPTEAKRNADARPLISDRELQQTTEIVTRAADTISEMARRNKIIEGEARKQVEHYKSEADSAHQRCAELQAKVESLQARMDEMASEFQGRVLELQGKLTACRSDLEVKTRDADLARQWLVYLSNEVMQRLGDAPARLDDLARQTRVPFRDEE
jgi:chromosome segregation ATPase